MAFYTTPPSRLTTPDLRELLDDGAVENVRLEFKLRVPDKKQTLKKLSSFANTFGGTMVVGAEEKDSRIVGLPGVDAEPGYKQRVVDWCATAVDPPLYVEVSDPIPTPDGTGKVCYVIRVLESETAPHFLNGRNGLWVRTDEFSKKFEARLATEAEVRQLLQQTRAHYRPTRFNHPARASAIRNLLGYEEGFRRRLGAGTSLNTIHHSAISCSSALRTGGTGVTHRRVPNAVAASAVHE